MENRISDKEIKAYMKKTGLHFTSRSNIAIYMLDNGRMISGEEIIGTGRTLDHNIMQDLIDADFVQKPEQSWNELLRASRLIMLVPETKTAILAENQKLTCYQRKFLYKYHYSISR